jgi:hypothetical protein
VRPQSSHLNIVANALAHGIVTGIDLRRIPGG